ncbi:MAG: YeeE/YedE thiosulfate transporter family protein [Pseudomonadales bacterium]|nr:YeeE/YedE thiosulfate transporter family protein [Pseudomonadales bacterium]
MISLIITLLFAAYIGFLAQATGLCLVRGVSESMTGRPLRLLAILLAGFWIYLYLPVLPAEYLSDYLPRYRWHPGFMLGGVLFGLGAALNGACSISTASRLSCGDLRMLFTMMGWLAGWLLLEFLDLRFTYQTEASTGSGMTVLNYIALALISLFSILVYWQNKTRWRTWRGIMLVGILAGAMFLLQPVWPPSDFVRDLGLSILHENAAGLPSLHRIGILLAMLVGMVISAWHYRRFRLILPDLLSTGRYLLSGMMMGAGAALALGGNDYQLLMAVPALSLAGISALASMLLGVFLGIHLLRRIQ